MNLPPASRKRSGNRCRDCIRLSSGRDLRRKPSLRGGIPIRYAMKMFPKFSLLAIAVVTFTAPALRAAGGANLDSEYQQVRKIALRDPKLQAA